MAYRIEENITWRQMWYNLNTFLSELTTIYDISYASAAGDGELGGLSVPQDTATSETWTLVCTSEATPAVFSVTGTVTGASLEATVGVPYDNGIIKFTLSAGAQPWAINDIITFTTEATTAPAWTPTTLDGEPIELIKQMYYKNGSSPTIHGSFRKIKNPPKPDSFTFAPVSAKTSGTFSSTCAACHIGPRIVTEIGNSEDLYKTVTFWVRNTKPIFSGDFTSGDFFGGVLSHTKTSSSNIYGYIGIGLYGGGIQYAVQEYGGGFVISFPYPDNWFIDNNIELNDWIMISAVISERTLSLYINGTYFGGRILNNYADIRISDIMGIQQFADINLWNKALTQEEIQQLVDDVDAVNWDGADITQSLRYTDADLLPWLILNNTDSDNNDISAVMTPQNGPHFAYELSSSYWGTPAKGDLTEQELEAFEASSASATNPNEGSGSGVYLLGGATSQVVSKSWFVATNDYIIIAYKIYDPSTQQQLPVYQLGYIGRTKTSEDMEYKAVIGTYASPSDYWYTSSTSLRSGVFYTANGKFMSLGEYASPTVINYSNAIGGFVDFENSYNIYPITYYNSSYYRNFGELHSIYGVQTTNVSLEDEFIIDGIRYIALGDGTRAGTNSLILLRLG